jgi:hypothetical protein
MPLVSLPFAVTFVQGLVRGLVGGVVPALVAAGGLRAYGVPLAMAAVVALGVAFASAAIAVGDLRAEVKHGDPTLASFVGGTVAPSLGMLPWLSPLGFRAGMRSQELPEWWELGVTVLYLLPGLGLGLSRTVAARYVRSATTAGIFLRAGVAATVISSILAGIHLLAIVIVLGATGRTGDVVPFTETLKVVAVLYGAFLAIATGHAVARPAERWAMSLLEPPAS